MTAALSEVVWHMLQTEADVEDKKEELAQSLFDHIPVGVGSQGIIPTTAADLEASLEMGMDWSLREASPCPALTAQKGHSSHRGPLILATRARRESHICLMWADERLPK